MRLSIPGLAQIRLADGTVYKTDATGEVLGRVTPAGQWIDGVATGDVADLASRGLVADAASSTALGPVRVGAGLQIDASGTLSATASSPAPATASVRGTAVLREINIKDPAYGAVGDGTTNDGPAIQAAITALSATGGTIYVPPGIYNCTSDVQYGLNSRANNGSIVIQGAGPDTATIRLNGANLNDGAVANSWANWNAGYTRLIIQDLSLRFTGNSGTGKGLWQGTLTLPQMTRAHLTIDGTYVDNATVLLGAGAGPIGETCYWQDVECDFNWTGGNFVRAVRLHFDTFFWQGGGINTNFAQTISDPRLLFLDPVYHCSISDISLFRAAGDTINLTYCLCYPSSEGKMEFTRCHLPRNVTNHFTAASGTPQIVLRNCSSDTSWPPIVSGCALTYENNQSSPSGLLYASTAAPLSIAATTVETVYGASATIAATSLRVGQVLRLTANGLYTTSGTPVTLVFKVKIGSTVLTTTGVFTPTNSLTNAGWAIDALLTIVALGTSGTAQIEAQGQATLGTTTTTSQVIQMTNTATIATGIDTTVSNVIGVSVTSGGVTAGNTTQMRQLVVESLS